jgi:hypothetical protein
MSFLKRLFGGGESADTGDGSSGARGGAGDETPLVSGPVTDGDPSLHRVVAWIPLNDPTFETSREQQRLFALEDRCMRALYESGAGDLDTNELDRGFFAIRFQGRDADAMTAVLAPMMGDVPRGSYLAVRRGPYGTAEDRVDLPVLDVSPAAG